MWHVLAVYCTLPRKVNDVHEYMYMLEMTKYMYGQFIFNVKIPKTMKYTLVHIRCLHTVFVTCIILRTLHVNVLYYQYITRDDQ